MVLYFGFAIAIVRLQMYGTYEKNSGKNRSNCASIKLTSCTTQKFYESEGKKNKLVRY